MKERILQYIAYKHITVRKFETLSGLANGYIKNMRSALGVEKLENVLKSFPDLNRIWLLTGEGEMLNVPTGYNQESEPKKTMLGEQMTDYGERLKENNIEMQRQLRDLLNETIRQGQRIDRILTLMEREKEQNGTK